jgi:hypothetical protein
MPMVLADDGVAWIDIATSIATRKIREQRIAAKISVFIVVTSGFAIDERDH